MNSRSHLNSSGGTWTFLTNHAHALFCMAQNPEIRLRDLAEAVGITERSAQGILADLVRDGYVTRTRVGRRNRYRVNPHRPLRHPLHQHRTVGDVLDLLGAPVA
jgi:DNA-binding MarR family transcriptional regulator